MARPIGSTNRFKDSINVTQMFQEYWGQPEKQELLNAKLLDTITNGGYRDSLSAITMILRYTAIPAEKQLESDTAANASLSKEEMLQAIKDLKQGVKDA